MNIEQLRGIFAAGRDAGRDDTGVWAVYMASALKPVARVVNEGRNVWEYHGKAGISAGDPRSPPELTDAYRAYKRALAHGQDEALRVVYDLGKVAHGSSSVSA